MFTKSFPHFSDVNSQALRDSMTCQSSQGWCGVDRTQFQIQVSLTSKVLKSLFFSLFNSMFNE